MMVSSKFARSKHAFRVPVICKKKLEPLPEEEGEYPPPIVHFTYDIDVQWLWFHYVFSGTNTLHIEEDPFGWSWRWMDADPPMPIGANCRFQHTWISGGWNANLWYYEDDLLKLASLQTGIIELEPPVIDTGPFELDFGPLWPGKRDAQVTS